MKFCSKKLASAHGSRKRDAIAKSAIAIWPTRLPVLVWQSGPDKLCTYFNKGWLEFTGRKAGGGRASRRLSALPRHPRFCVRTARTFVTEYRLRHRSGGYRRVLDRSVPQFNSDGTFLGYVGGAVDTHDRKLGEETLHQSEEQLRHTLEFNQAVMARKNVR